jgi:hypothetical protein
VSPQHLSPGKPLDTAANAAESADGVDVSLIRWMLSLTPDERLDVLQAFVDGVVGVSNGRASAEPGV